MACAYLAAAEALSDGDAALRSEIAALRRSCETIGGGGGAVRRTRRQQRALARASREASRRRFEEAARILQGLVAERPDDTEARRRLALVRLSLAREALSVAESETPERRWQRVTLLLWAAADVHPLARTAAVYRDIARLERQRARVAAARGDRPTQRAALLRAFAADVSDPATLLALVRLEWASGRTQAAEAWQRILERQAPDAAELAFLRFRAQILDGPPEQALERLEAFASKFPRASALAAELRRLAAERASAAAARRAAEAAVELERLSGEVQQVRKELAERLERRARGEADRADGSGGGEDTGAGSPRGSAPAKQAQPPPETPR
ncbi:MAG: hypothetical protein D6776_04600 [Planctomycetota bacterium]|nr:MAG: hypothetical protein D6776_04600 [Planctomycetota bacterium]